MSEENGTRAAQHRHVYFGATALTFIKSVKLQENQQEKQYQMKNSTQQEHT